MSTKYEAKLMYGIEVDSFEDAVNFLVSKKLMSPHSVAGCLETGILYSKPNLSYFEDIDGTKILGFVIYPYRFLELDYLKFATENLDSKFGEKCNFYNFVKSY